MTNFASHILSVSGATLLKGIAEILITERTQTDEPPQDPKKKIRLPRHL